MSRAALPADEEGNAPYQQLSMDIHSLRSDLARGTSLGAVVHRGLRREAWTPPRRGHCQWRQPRPQYTLRHPPRRPNPESATCTPPHR